MEEACSLPLPDAFIDFLKENGLDPSIYSASDSIPRYLRIKPGSESELLGIEDEIKCKLEKVLWLPGFYAIPPHIQIASSDAYRQGKAQPLPGASWIAAWTKMKHQSPTIITGKQKMRNKMEYEIYGMDAASGAAVAALNASRGDHVLDLCSAPGAKLCMLSDLLGDSGSLTGVDVARHRLAACRTMLQKYALGDRCRLFVANGTSFSLLPLRAQMDESAKNISGMPASIETADTFAEWTPRRPWKERKKAMKERNGSHLASADAEPELMFYGTHSGVVGLSKNKLFQTGCGNVAGYDKVLVDAECTHDGSFRHIQKFEQWGWRTLQQRVLDAQRTDTLTDLQLHLLTNGFRLLKVGGTLVYSTCSLTVGQNEDVVERFLSRNPSAEVQEIDAAKNWPCKSGQIPKTLRFDPLTSKTSGLFIAKLKKLTT